MIVFALPCLFPPSPLLPPPSMVLLSNLMLKAQQAEYKEMDALRRINTKLIDENAQLKQENYTLSAEMKSLLEEVCENEGQCEGDECRRGSLGDVCRGCECHSLCRWEVIGNDIRGVCKTIMTEEWLFSRRCNPSLNATPPNDISTTFVQRRLCMQ